MKEILAQLQVTLAIFLNDNYILRSISDSLFDKLGQGSERISRERVAHAVPQLLANLQQPLHDFGVTTPPPSSEDVMCILKADDNSGSEEVDREAFQALMLKKLKVSGKDLAARAWERYSLGIFGGLMAVSLMRSVVGLLLWMPLISDVRLLLNMVHGVLLPWVLGPCVGVALTYDHHHERGAMMKLVVHQAAAGYHWTAKQVQLRASGDPHSISFSRQRLLEAVTAAVIAALEPTPPTCQAPAEAPLHTHQAVRQDNAPSQASSMAAHAADHSFLSSHSAKSSPPCTRSSSGQRLAGDDAELITDAEAQEATRCVVDEAPATPVPRVPRRWSIPFLSGSTSKWMVGAADASPVKKDA